MNKRPSLTGCFAIRDPRSGIGARLKLFGIVRHQGTSPGYPGSVVLESDFRGGPHSVLGHSQAFAACLSLFLLSLVRSSAGAVPLRSDGGEQPSALSGSASVTSPRPIIRTVLPNGVTLLIRLNSASDVVGMEVVSRVGSAYEAPTKAGLALLTLRTALGGTGRYSASQIRNWFEDRGASLDTKVHPDYSEIGAAVQGRYYPDMVRLIGAIVQHATLSTRSFEEAKNRLLQEVTASADDEEAITYRSLRTLLAGGGAYGRSELGVPSTLQPLTLEDVSGFYRILSAPQNLVVAISGNLKADEALRLLTSQFGASPAPAYLPTVPPIHTTVREPASMVLAGNGDAAWLMVGFLTPGLRDPDYPAVVTLNAILGGANSGVLTSLFRDRKGIYDSGSFVQPFASQTHIVVFVRADPLLWNDLQQREQSTIDALVKTIQSVFAGLREHGVSPEQLEFGKNFAVGQILRSEERNRDAAGYLGWYEVTELGASYNDRLMQEIRGVTPEQINRLIRNYFQSPLQATVVTLPRPRAEANP